MLRTLRTVHLLSFGLLFGGLAAVAIGAPIERVGRLLGIGTLLLLASGGGMIAMAKGRNLRMNWLRVHLGLAVALLPLLFVVHQRAGFDGGQSALIAALVAALGAGIAIIRPRLGR